MQAVFLSAEQANKIHQASLAILDRTGVEVPHDDMLSRFADHGAKVDRAGRRVRIPGDLVMKLVGQAGKKFTLFGRDPARKAEFGTGRRNYNSVAGEAYWIDAPGGRRRYATLDDVVKAARFADALDTITIPGAMSDPHELPASWRCVAVAAAMVRNTTKPVTFWFHDRKSARHLVELMIALRGSAGEAERRPLFYPFLEPISPLRFPFHGIDLLYETARINLPVPIGPMAQAGISAPATVAGTLAQENAEILAGICITQLVRAGMPVCYGGICHAFDMATMQTIFSGPEQAIFGVAMTQMGRHYGLPVYINVGLSDAKRPDAQAGMEAGITLAMGAAAGADIFGHMGISGVDQAASLDMLLLQSEVIAYVESMLRRTAIDNDTLGLDEIEEVARTPGATFIDREHAARHFRNELWQPWLLDRQYYQAWLDGGARSMEERIAVRKEEILRRPAPPPLTDDLEKAVDAVLAAARKEADCRPQPEKKKDRLTG